MPLPNPKLRELIRQIKFEESYHHLWICPTKAYYSVEGEVVGRNPRKRLIFSRWQAVPQAVSILAELSMRMKCSVQTIEFHGDSLKLSYSSVELAPVLFHPSLWLAEAGLAIYSKRTCGRTSLEVLEQSVAALLEKELTARGIRVTDGRLDFLETIAAVLHRMEPRNYSELYRKSINSKFHCWPKSKRASGDDNDAD